MRGKEFLEVPLSLLTENSRSGKMIAVNHQACLCHYKKCRLIKIVEGENLDMTFPNAAVGVKKLFVAEILALIASACALVEALALAFMAVPSDFLPPKAEAIPKPRTSTTSAHAAPSKSFLLEANAAETSGI